MMNQTTIEDKSLSTKQLDWSYPTSDNAKRLGFYATGCWAVGIAEYGEISKAIAGFASKDDAIAYARSLPMPFGSFWKQYNAPALHPGQLVKFSAIVDAGDELERMRIIEVSGDRILVECICDMPILPTRVLPAIDVVPAE